MEELIERDRILPFDDSLLEANVPHLNIFDKSVSA